MLTRLVLLFALLLQTLNADTIRLHPQNPHYFLFRGKAVALISSGEHYGAVLNADFDYRRYLSTLEANGLNYTRLFGGIYKTREVSAPQRGKTAGKPATRTGNRVASNADKSVKQLTRRLVFPV